MERNVEIDKISDGKRYGANAFSYTHLEVYKRQPFNCGRQESAFCASSLCAAVADRAIRTSSVWRRGFLLPRYFVFSVWIGAMDSGERTCTSCSIPERSFKAFSRSAALEPSRSLVFPVMMRCLLYTSAAGYVSQRRKNYRKKAGTL